MKSDLTQESTKLYRGDSNYVEGIIKESFSKSQLQDGLTKHTDYASTQLTSSKSWSAVLQHCINTYLRLRNMKLGRTYPDDNHLHCPIGLKVTTKYVDSFVRS